jgi:hypothetical protein
MERYGFSPQYYDVSRRRRAWSMRSRQGLEGYAAFLAGEESVSPNELGSVVGAGTAAYETSAGVNPARAVFIGVATGALTFLVNRWLGKVLG